VVQKTSSASVSVESTGESKRNVALNSGSSNAGLWNTNKAGWIIYTNDSIIRLGAANAETATCTLALQTGGKMYGSADDRAAITPVTGSIFF